jgi:hypothetical protein
VPPLEQDQSDRDVEAMDSMGSAKAEVTNSNVTKVEVRVSSELARPEARQSSTEDQKESKEKTKASRDENIKSQIR